MTVVQTRLVSGFNVLLFTTQLLRRLGCVSEQHFQDVLNKVAQKRRCFIFNLLHRWNNLTPIPVLV